MADRVTDGDDLMARRRLAAEEEAEALRAEVVRWVRSGEAGQETSAALRDLVRDGLDDVVREALADGDVVRRLASDLRAQLAGAFEEEIRDAVGREVRRALQEELFSKPELEALRAEIREAARQAATAAPDLPSRPRRPSGAPAHRGGSQGHSGLPPSRAAFGSRPGFSGIDWTRPGVLITAGLTLVALFGLLWVFVLRPDPGVQATGAADPAAPPPSQASGESSAPVGETASPPAAPSESPLLPIWSARVVPRYPAPATLAARPAERFSCWFSGAVPDDLAEAVREAEGAAGSGALENRLRTLFPDCVGADAVATGANTAVFAAQAAAHAALSRRAATGWAGCRALPQAPDLDGFQADGVRGPGTYALLDALATCRGVATALNVDGSSDVTDYLFALYLALDDLEGTA